MIVIMMVLATLSACVAAAFNFTAQVGRGVERSNDLRGVYEIADGALESAFVQWREKCRTHPTYNFPVGEMGGFTAPVFNNVPGFGTPQGPRIVEFSVKAVKADWRTLPDNIEPEAQFGMAIGTQNRHYLARAKVIVPSLGGDVWVESQRIFTKSYMSPWNYAIFYVDDLEHHPGPASVVTGWVHTNSKLYTAHNSLTYQSKVSYGDDWEKNFKPGDNRRTGTAQAGPNWQQTLPPFRDQGQQPFGLDSSRIFETGGSSANDDSYRELVEVPSGSGTDPIGDARYYNQAGMKILVDSAGNKVFRKLDGTQVKSTDPVGSDNRKLYDAFNAAVSVGTTITDKRENASVRLIDVNVGALITSLNAAGMPNFNNIIYVSDASGSSSTKRAVRLKNGATINRAAGITFATDNALYIQGDYNTGRTSSSNEPQSNKGDPTKPTVSGYTRKSCAVLADAVMILSNNWNDANSSQGLSSRDAAPTTVNTAIVSGIVPTANGYYSGGAENFPRFLEDWDNTTVTYYGSMVELYPSKQFNTRWKETGTGNNVYNAPLRRWYFDTNFYSNPPPGSLQIISYNKGRWWNARNDTVSYN